MTELNKYLFHYIDELDNIELMNLKQELINDIEYLKTIKDNKAVEFENKRLKYVEHVLEERNKEYKKILSI